MKKTIFLSIIILITLILITYLISLFLKTKKQALNQKMIPIPTIDYQSYLNKKQTPLQSDKNKTKYPDKINQTTQKEFLKKLSFLSQDDIDKLEKAKKKLSYHSNYFDADYSFLLDQIIISKKKSQSQNAINKWLGENQLLNIADKTNFIIITNQPLEEFITKNEEIIKNNNQKTLKTAFDLKPTITTILKPSLNNKTTLFSDILSILNNPFNDNSTLSSNLNSPSVNDSSINTSKPFSPLTLTEIFNEAGKRVGVPPKILEAVMSIEYPSTFKLSSDKIALYSTPENSIPGCGPNVCSAAGPMQITTGADNQGSSSCSTCCSSRGCLDTRGGCPNQWARYGSSIIRYGSYSHTPNPCNIKDSVYAAAEKLKNDSQATDPDNWTQEQVYKASRHYYGSCSNDFRYARLGNRTYCEYVWWYYNIK